MGNNIHIGSLIRKEVKKSGCNIGEFAKALNCDRSNVYKIFEKQYIDLIQLLKIVDIIGYDFLADLFKSKNHIVVLETNINKIEELQKDNNIKILYIL